MNLPGAAVVAAQGFAWVKRAGHKGPDFVGDFETAVALDL